MDDSHRSRRYAAWLALLLGLFALRVLGQVLVAFLDVRWLPPMEEWMSGLLAYRWLLPSQIAILLLLGKVVLDFGRGQGFFVVSRAAFARGAIPFGMVYLGSMAVRYIATMALHPERRWLGHTIPIVFHCVLASFVIVFGMYHRALAGHGGRGFPVGLGGGQVHRPGHEPLSERPGSQPGRVRLGLSVASWLVLGPVLVLLVPHLLGFPTFPSLLLTVCPADLLWELGYRGSLIEWGDGWVWLTPPGICLFYGPIVVALSWLSWPWLRPKARQRAG